LTDIPGIEFVFFSKNDVVRHKLVQNIIQAYETAALQKEQLSATSGPAPNGKHRER
jgi:phosphate starvation-inducible protein PhoH